MEDRPVLFLPMVRTSVGTDVPVLKLLLKNEACLNNKRLSKIYYCKGFIGLTRGHSIPSYISF